ncbi:DUF2391 family protein [Halanaeroarchaeum sulfurireducens]|uniref:DUF2391 domain-containing protein n=1 Tax=Halanaeroarchaeum sulfurireducens TaxID=1604004 RepID=A0A0F7PAK8_9EURY|nr:DUF2391 family protein [Halanaeroarchaeum sulfurireducens]AKH98206.1 hypothetical protein HLASF_1731 [Halanaeroarchaeum sulfurireducens]ALG82600.1 hypothetical protein HLASA_1718 [Halanaeroarchaeum sulfurireducens]
MSDPGDEPSLVDLIDDLERIEDTLEDETARSSVEEAIATARRIDTPPVFGRVIRGFDRADLTEATVGSLLLGIPMFVEGGTNEAGAFIATRPLAMIVTIALVIGLTVGIIYVADIQDVRVHEPILGFVPRRLVGVLGASLITATLMMTVWGRVDWAEPWLAVSQIVVAMVPMSIGGALGDILPGS